VKIFWYKKKSNGQLHLIPIDHSYILPDNLSNAWFDWLYWPQAKVHFSKETLAYIARLNIEEDIKILQQLGFSEQSMINLEITTLFLKSAAEKIGIYMILENSFLRRLQLRLLSMDQWLVRKVIVIVMVIVSPRFLALLPHKYL